MKRRSGRGIIGLLFLANLTLGGGAVLAQATQPAAGPGTTAITPLTPPPVAAVDADAAATRPAMPKVEEVLSKKTATFDFSGKPIKDVLAYLGESYDIHVVNSYEETDKKTMELKITMKIAQPMSAGEAIAVLNDTLVSLGYSAVPTVRGDPPQVVLTVQQVARDGAAIARVFHGNDPDQIPEGDEIRTQVFTVKNLDPAAAKEAIAPVLGKRSDITVNGTSKTMIVTDTSSHIHTAAVLLQVLDKQAGGEKKP